MPKSRALLCNVVDVPELCSFILPAVHRHEPIAVAVSTGGASPALAQHLRDQIATVVRPEHAELAHRLRELRPWAKSHFATYEERKAYFAGLVARGARHVTVHLVGAGPGDPGLITARGLELVRACDVLVADALVAQELIDEAPDDAIVISRAGHEAGGGHAPARRLRHHRPRRRPPQGRRPVRLRPRRRGGARARRGRHSASRSSPASRRSRPFLPRR